MHTLQHVEVGSRVSEEYDRELLQSVHGLQRVPRRSKQEEVREVRQSVREDTFLEIRMGEARQCDMQELPNTGVRTLDLPSMQ